MNQTMGGFGVASIDDLLPAERALLETDRQHDVVFALHIMRRELLDNLEGRTLSGADLNNVMDCHIFAAAMWHDDYDARVRRFLSFCAGEFTGKAFSECLAAAVDSVHAQRVRGADLLHAAFQSHR